MQTVTSNLDLTERKNAINFYLKVDSVQGRLGIYAWMITVILSWHLLTSEVFFSKRSKKHRKLPKQSQNCLFPADLTIFSINLSLELPTHQIWRHSDHFCPIYNTIQFFQICRKSIEIAKNGAKTGQNGAIFGWEVM